MAGLGTAAGGSCFCLRSPALYPIPLRVPHRRTPALAMLFDLPASNTPALTEQLAAAFRPEYELGLLSPERVPEAAEMLVDAFFLADGSADVPPQPDDSSGRRPVANGASSREERLGRTARGLEWRLGSRLQSPDLSLSLESSLLLALSEKQTGQLAACAELSLRPRDGRLPAEFTVPPLFLLHSAGLAPYLCNLAVARRHRRRRLARRLLEACEWLVSAEWQQAELYLHVDMYNAGATALYSSAGYESLPSFDDVAAASSALQSNSGALAAQRTPVLNRYHVKRLGPGNAPPAGGMAGHTEAATQGCSPHAAPHADPNAAVGGREMVAGASEAPGAAVAAAARRAFATGRGGALAAGEAEAEERGVAVGRQATDGLVVGVRSVPWGEGL